jgi:hypothetical protein
MLAEEWRSREEKERAGISSAPLLLFSSANVQTCNVLTF